MTRTLAQRIIQKFRREGFPGVRDAIRYRVNRKFVQRQRCLISHRVARSLDYSVRYGPFEGLKLMENETWGCDQGTKCMGFYEQQVQEALVEIRQTRGRTILFDIGGADGYFAVGSLVRRLYDFVFVFESSSAARRNMEEMAQLNDVRRSIEIHGEASQSSIREVFSGHPELKMEKVVFLVDIEGAEFHIFSNDFLDYLSAADLIIEMHDRTLGRQKFDRFKSAIFSHEVREIICSSRDPRAYRELDMLMDDDCWLLMSEGRHPMKWLYLRSLGQLDLVVRNEGLTGGWSG